MGCAEETSVVEAVVGAALETWLAFVDSELVYCVASSAVLISQMSAKRLSPLFLASTYLSTSSTDSRSLFPSL